MIQRITFSLLACLISFSAMSQLPKPAIVGYWQSWGSAIKLQNIDSRYNVIHVAFASLKAGKDYELEYFAPSGYADSAFKSDIAVLQAQGKKIIRVTHLSRIVFN